MPHSWEIVKQRADSCLIAIVAPPGGVSVDWALSWGNMVKPSVWDVMRLSGLPWDVARTQAAIQCLNGGYQFLFQLDSDVCAPKDTIPRLMAHRLPIVSGLYHQRFPTWDGVTANYMPVMFNEVVGTDGKLTKQAIVDYKPGSLVTADYVPGGCLLVHRSVFERMTQAGIKRYFQWTLQVDSEPPGSGRSEDFEFCLPKGTMVYGYDVKSIENIKLGDRVLTHKGTLKRVTRLFKRPYCGKLTIIKPAYGEPLPLTGNHPVLTKRADRISWLRADEVQAGDWLFVPYPSRANLGVSSLHINSLISAKNARRENNTIYYPRTHKTAPRVPLNLELTPALLRLLGYYVAEGSTGAGKCSLEFSFGRHEDGLVEDTQALLRTIFATKASIYGNGNVKKVVASSKILAHLFANLCGSGANNKRLPRFWYELDNQQLEQLIQGYWRGDGCEGSLSATTVSKKLAHQMKMALLRFGIMSGVYHRNQGGYQINIAAPSQGNFSRLTNIGHGNNSQSPYHKWCKRIEHIKVDGVVSPHGGFWVKVRKANRQNYEGYVYNLSVETNESYAAQGIVVHNCFKARQLGFKCYVDTSIVATHETGAQVGVKGLLPKL